MTKPLITDKEIYPLFFDKLEITKDKYFCNEERNCLDILQDNYVWASYVVDKLVSEDLNKSIENVETKENLLDIELLDKSDLLALNLFKYFMVCRVLPTFNLINVYAASKKKNQDKKEELYIELLINSSARLQNKEIETQLADIIIKIINKIVFNQLNIKNVYFDHVRKYIITKHSMAIICCLSKLICSTKNVTKNKHTEFSELFDKLLEKLEFGIVFEALITCLNTITIIPKKKGSENNPFNQNLITRSIIVEKLNHLITSSQKLYEILSFFDKNSTCVEESTNETFLMNTVSDLIIKAKTANRPAYIKSVIEQIIRILSYSDDDNLSKSNKYLTDDRRYSVMKNSAFILAQIINSAGSSNNALYYANFVCYPFRMWIKLNYTNSSSLENKANEKVSDCCFDNTNETVKLIADKEYMKSRINTTINLLNLMNDPILKELVKQFIVKPYLIAIFNLYQKSRNCSFLNKKVKNILKKALENNCQETTDFVIDIIKFNTTIKNNECFFESNILGEVSLYHTSNTKSNNFNELDIDYLIDFIEELNQTQCELTFNIILRSMQDIISEKNKELKLVFTSFLLKIIEKTKINCPLKMLKLSTKIIEFIIPNKNNITNPQKNNSILDCRTYEYQRTLCIENKEILSLAINILSISINNLIMFNNKSSIKMELKSKELTKNTKNAIRNLRSVDFLLGKETKDLITDIELKFETLVLLEQQNLDKKINTTSNKKSEKDDDKNVMDLVVLDTSLQKIYTEKVAPFIVDGLQQLYNIIINNNKLAKENGEKITKGLLFSIKNSDSYVFLKTIQIITDYCLLVDPLFIESIIEIYSNPLNNESLETNIRLGEVISSYYFKNENCSLSINPTTFHQIIKGLMRIIKSFSSIKNEIENEVLVSSALSIFSIAIELHFIHSHSYVDFIIDYTKHVIIENANKDIAVNQSPTRESLRILISIVYNLHSSNIDITNIFENIEKIKTCFLISLNHNNHRDRIVYEYARYGLDFINEKIGDLK